MPDIDDSALLKLSNGVANVSGAFALGAVFAGWFCDVSWCVRSGVGILSLITFPAFLVSLVLENVRRRRR